MSHTNNNLSSVARPGQGLRGVQLPHYTRSEATYLIRKRRPMLEAPAAYEQPRSSRSGASSTDLKKIREEVTGA